MVKRRLKKQKTGVATKFYTRSQALRRLKLRLSEFRRLCILKGIFPKEPPKFFKGVNKTYYSKKDITFLSNEKLLKKFMEIKTYEKKIIKAQKKNEKFDAGKLIENKPTYSLDHIIKERYPKFNDALQDMDDCLSLISIFANLPKFDLLKISEQKTYLSKKLLREFFLYIAISQCFRKGFLSIKGIYLNIEIQGNKITWLSPMNHPQKISYEVDYDIMSSFLELYLNLMKFVNFRLFKDIGLTYPPPEENSDTMFFGFNALDIRKFQEKYKENNKDLLNKAKEEIDIQSDEWKKIIAKEEENNKIKNLFKDYVFYINREIPKEIFSMIIVACGGLYGDDSDNSPFDENDERITHYICDKPPEFIEFKKNKEYVQPQWIFDCVNKATLLPVGNYAPGKKLPPHISPFYEVDKEGNYVYEGDESYEEEDKDEGKENKKNKGEEKKIKKE
ncbi:MAG: hypothetical protein MJ252_08845, partial [archaeon]|nr:hypothetical protein [archaeon]